MKSNKLDRRNAIKGMGVLLSGAAIAHSCEAKATSSNADVEKHQFSYCLNTSTIMGQKVGLEREIEIASDAGYDGIEIWIPTLNKFIEEGGSLKELKKKIDDLGIKVENAIGFAEWIVADDTKRAAALEQAKKEMGLLAQVGCARIAAPPAGATKDVVIDLDKAGKRFHDLLEVGIKEGVIPQLEIWGFSENLTRLSQVLHVASECGHAKTRILPDVYHLYKGGSNFDGLKLLNGASVEIFHMNDYPASPGREEIQDKDRVYPGLGVGPVKQVLQDLYNAGGPKVLSLELFNRTYWEKDPLEVAKTGLKSMQDSVSKAMA